MPPTDYEVLVAELGDDPLQRGYAGMADQAAADSLNGVNRTVADPTRKTFRDLLRKGGMADAGIIHGKLKAAAATDDGVALAIGAAGDYGSDGGLDFSASETVAGIDMLVAGGVLTSQEADALKSLGQRTVSRAEELGLGLVTDGHVGSARIRMGERDGQ
jgi:hypothetical protein